MSDIEILSAKDFFILFRTKDFFQSIVWKAKIFKGSVMDYIDLPNGAEFVEDGRRYIIIKNVSYFLRVHLPYCSSAVLVFRPDDSGLTFRGGTMSEENIVLK